MRIWKRRRHCGGSAPALRQRCPPRHLPAQRCAAGGTRPADLLPDSRSDRPGLCLTPPVLSANASCYVPGRGPALHTALATPVSHDRPFSPHAETLGPGRKNVLTRRNRSDSGCCGSGPVDCSRLASTGRWQPDKGPTEEGTEALLLRRDHGSGLGGARGAARHGVRGRAQGLSANLKYALYAAPT